MNMMGDAKMFIRYPLNLEEEQKNRMITKFHSSKSLRRKSSVIFVFFLSVSVRMLIFAHTHFLIHKQTHNTFVAPIILFEWTHYSYNQSSTHAALLFLCILFFFFVLPVVHGNTLDNQLCKDYSREKLRPWHAIMGPRYILLHLKSNIFKVGKNSVKTRFARKSTSYYIYTSYMHTYIHTHITT